MLPCWNANNSHFDDSKFSIIFLISAKFAGHETCVFFFPGVLLQKRWKTAVSTSPQTNIVLKNGGCATFFLLGFGLFSGVDSLLVSGRVCYLISTWKYLQTHPLRIWGQPTTQTLEDITILDLLVGWLEKKIFPKSWVSDHGDESHGIESVKKSPTKQKKAI